jgi:flagellar protein FlaJ
MLKKLIIKLSEFGLKRFSSYFKPLEEIIRLSNIGILFEVYVGLMIFLSLLGFFLTFFSMFFGSIIFLKLPIIFSLIGSLIVGLSVAFIVLTIFHSYPYRVLSNRKSSIEANLPFAINHMAAIAASGVPPLIIFRLVAEVEEYGKLADEIRLILRNATAFGMDLITAVKQVAERTPSEQFKEFLYSFISTIETGGDLKRFLDEASREAIMDYRLKRERYAQLLSTYADFYTTLLIAGPLFFVSILSIVSMLGGTLMGLPMDLLIQVGVYIFIPLLNFAFILFLHLTQPSV